MGCKTSDDARILQLLNERGFGRKYTGNANEQFYFGVGDTIAFADSINPEIAGSVRIRMDGTVTFPQLGETYVAGLTSHEIEAMLSRRMGHYYKMVDITVQPGAVQSKWIYIQLDTDKHIRMPFQGDQTLYDVMQKTKYDSILVDMDDIRVIRSDPAHPLVIHCDIHDMIHYGESRDNILLKEDDIIYFTPSLIGYLTIFVRTLLAPLDPIANLFNRVQYIDRTIETFDEGYNYNNRRRGGLYGYY